MKKEGTLNDVKLYDKKTGEEVANFDSVRLEYTGNFFTSSTSIDTTPYRIDFSKVNTFEDMKALMEALVGTSVFQGFAITEKLKPFLVRMH